MCTSTVTDSLCSSYKQPFHFSQTPDRWRSSRVFWCAELVRACPGQQTGDLQVTPHYKRCPPWEKEEGNFHDKQCFTRFLTSLLFYYNVLLNTTQSIRTWQIVAKWRIAVSTTTRNKTKMQDWYLIWSALLKLCNSMLFGQQRCTINVEIFVVTTFYGLNFLLRG